MRGKTTLVVALAAFLSLSAIPVAAQVGNGFFISQSGCSYNPPLDTQSGAAAAFSFRKLRSAYSGKAMNIQRASDNATTDIGFASSCNFDVGAFNTFCAATTCSVKIWYDQSGNGANASQATLATQPTITANCQNSQPCAVFSSVAQNWLSATLASGVGSGSFAFVGQVTVSGSHTSIATGDGTNAINAGFSFGSTACTASRLVSGSGFSGTLACNANSHRFASIANASLSRIYVDGVQGTDNTSSATPASTTAFYVGRNGANSSWHDGKLSEVVLFSPDLSATNLLVVSSNQGAYWGL